MAKAGPIPQRRIGQVAVVAPEGRLDAATAPNLKDLLKGLVARGESRIVLDMSGVDFVDSSGLGVLVASLKTAESAGGDLRLASMSPGVRGIFELIKLHLVFRIFDDREGALKSWANL